MADDQRRSVRLPVEPRPARPALSGGRAGRPAAGRFLAVLGAYFPEAGRMFAANLPVLGWAAAIYLLISVTLLAVLGLAARAIGSPWPALVLTAVPLVLLVMPLVRLTVCHLALNIWDDGEASLLEAAGFARSNYFDALGASGRALIYESALLMRYLSCLLPGLMLSAAWPKLAPGAENWLTVPASWEPWLATVAAWAGLAVLVGAALILARRLGVMICSLWGLVLSAGLYWIPFFTGFALSRGRELAIILILTGFPAVCLLWGQARRVSTFLYRFNAFEIVDGRSAFSQDLAEGPGGNWGSRFARMYHRLDQEPFPHEFNLPLLAALASALIWLTPSVWILAADLTPLSKIYLLAVGPFLFRFVIGLWYSIAAAGYYRANLAPEDSRYGG